MGMDSVFQFTNLVREATIWSLERSFSSKPQLPPSLLSNTNSSVKAILSLAHTSTDSVMEVVFVSPRWSTALSW